MPPGTSTRQWFGRAVAGPVPGGERGGGGTRAAGEGLAAAALVHAHPDVADAVVHERVGGHDELDVRAVDRVRVDHRDVGEVGAVELLVARERDDDVRVADVDAETRARDRQVPRAHERLAAVELQRPRST